MAGLVQGDLRHLFAMLRVASPPGPAKATVFLEDMTLLVEDVCSQRNHCPSTIIQLLPGDQRRATFSFLRQDISLWPLAGRVR